VPNRIDASPTRNDWADDVEADVTSKLTAPGFDDPSTSVSITPREPTAMENTKPNTNSSELETTAAYRHHEPQDTTRSVSDPVPRELTIPSTPTKQEPNRTKAPLSHHDNEGTCSVAESNCDNKVIQNPPATRGRGRGRGRHRQYGNRGRGGRSTSNPQKSSSATRLTTSTLK
jgi:hypothetical protein